MAKRMKQMTPERLDAFGEAWGRGDRGCDVFEFVGDKIRRKDAFRKTFS
jgi:hypothetical protein